MPQRTVPVRDHDRRKPHQQETTHVDRYTREQNVSGGPPPGASDLGPREEFMENERECEVCGHTWPIADMKRLPGGEWICGYCNNKDLIFLPVKAGNSEKSIGRVISFTKSANGRPIVLRENIGAVATPVEKNVGWSELAYHSGVAGHDIEAYVVEGNGAKVLSRNPNTGELDFTTGLDTELLSPTLIRFYKSAFGGGS